MEWGSSYVWMYEDSDEEYVSETELREGMWLSLSESDPDDDLEPTTLTPEAAVHPSKLEKKHGTTNLTKTTPASGASNPALEGSTTKYLQDKLGDEDEKTKDMVVVAAALNSSLKDGRSGSESETEDSEGDDKKEVVKPKPKLRGRARVRKEPKYIEVEHLQLDQPESGYSSRKPAKKPSKKKEKDTTRVDYVKFGDLSLKSAPRPQTHSEPAMRGARATSPPPPRPPKGIIKNRLAPPGIKKLKRARVNWDRSDYDRTQSRRDGRFTRRADTNVLAVKFNTLVEPSGVHTGDSVACGNTNCTAILSHLSTIRDHADPQKEEKIWQCEFCGTENEVDIVPEERPTKDDTTFMIAPASVAGGVAGGVSGGVEDSLVVFCIDISGSMCVSTEVPGKFELKGHDRIRSLSTLNVHNEDQYLPRQRRDVTYVSRLQSVQAAVDHQLTMLASARPTNKVALVTFGDEVTVIGDGCGQPLTLAGDKLWNADAIVKVGGEIPLPTPIKDTNKKLSEKVFELMESGQTALGPALLLSITMAARIPGSKVIFCTDGLANKGVGNLDDLRSDEARAAAQTFYENMGTLALEKNVTVSLVRIKGTDCKALELGQVADKTGGQVTTVNPLNITKEFTSILANPVIATNVRTKIVLHRELYFRTEETAESMLLIPVGNVTAETELTYEYGSRTKKNQTKTNPDGDEKLEGATAGGGFPPLKIDGKIHLPFQLQIEYTGKDGSRCVRVITRAKPVTRDRGVAERDIHMGVVGSHVVHNTAKLTMDGEYTGARLNAMSSQRLLQRTSHANSDNRVRYNNLMEDLIPLERTLATKQQRERSQYQRQHSDDECQYDDVYNQDSSLMATQLAAPMYQNVDLDLEQAPPRPRSIPKKKKAVARRGSMEDDLAVYCYNMRATKSSDYTNVDHDDDDDDDDDEED